MIKRIIIGFLLLNSVTAKKYCANIMGNELNVSLGKNANVSANMFGTIMSCSNIPYNETNDHIYFPSDPNSCLNRKLKSMAACPCPPHILEKNNMLEVEDTYIGTIELKSC